MDTKMLEKEPEVCRMGNGIPEKGSNGVGYIAAAVLDEAGRLILPEGLRMRMNRAPGAQVWVCLTGAGLLAEYGGDYCRICGEPLDPDAPCVICPSCIREVRETGAYDTQES